MKKINAKLEFVAFILVIASIAVVQAAPVSQPARAKKAKAPVVYVCACLKTKSCPCMTESKMEGPCACGTQGGPPLRPVASDSNWAKENRDALANGSN